MMHEILEHSNRTRVLINGLHAKSGGGVTYLRNVLPLFGEDPSLEIHLFIHSDQYDMFQDSGGNIRIHLLNFPTGFFRLLLWEQAVLPVMAKMIGTDVVFSPANYGPLAIRNQVILLRNSLAVGRREWRIMRRLYWITLALATQLSLIIARRAIAVSEFAAKTIAPSWARRKIEVVHHGVGELFRADSGNDTKRKDFFLMVADIYVQKNLHTVINALSIVKKNNPGVRLLIAGGILDRSYYDQLRGQIERLGLSENIEFLGSKSPQEVKELYHTARAMIFASTVEAFGNPLVEAMASGCPVLSSNAAAMPEVAGDGVFYFDPYDDGGLAILLEQVLMDDDLCAELSKRAFNRGRSFSWAITAKKTGQILRDTAHHAARERA